MSRREQEGKWKGRSDSIVTILAQTMFLFSHMINLRTLLRPVHQSVRSEWLFTNGKRMMDYKHYQLLRIISPVPPEPHDGESSFHPSVWYFKSKTLILVSLNQCPLMLGGITFTTQNCTS